MKEISVLILMIALLGLAENSSATSPMPEEVKPGQTENICTVHVAYSLDREKGILLEETSSTLTFEPSMSRKDVLDKITKHLSNRLNDVNVSEFKVECKFPKQ